MIDDYLAPRLEDNTLNTISVTQLVREINDMLSVDFSQVSVVGEVSSFKINQGKWVFFDLKDENTKVGCFMPVFKLHTPLEDGMQVQISGRPNLTKWGSFSLTVENIIPVGSGSIKRAFELLKAKLEKEGLFDPAKKRPLPEDISTIGVISSTQAAGYADFIKIVNERWGGLKLVVAHTGVQGAGAAEQIIRALNYMNEHNSADVIAIIRGGGSADDLAVFNDEALVRAIASSKIPVITGIGHEIDTSLADLAADIVASTPSNAAQMLTRDRREYIEHIKRNMEIIYQNCIANQVRDIIHNINDELAVCIDNVLDRIETQIESTKSLIKYIETFNPDNVLKKGYAMLRGTIDIGSEIEITTKDKIINAEIKALKERK